jgi:hypothetical protein
MTAKYKQKRHVGPTPASLSSSCRYDSNAVVGDRGVVYEFDIKMPPLDCDITEGAFERESGQAFGELADLLGSKYKWIGSIRRSGRSGGWLAITDKKGGATVARLKKIIEDVELEKRAFARYLERKYPV